MRSLFAPAVVLVALPTAAFAASPSRSAERPVVVELFTSQGCSSCPPADAYLRELARGRGDVLPLTFHVTYWNGLGWRDPYAIEAATLRQEAYGRRLGESSFTPQLVVDGRTSLVGSRRDEAAAAIAGARARAPTAVAMTLHRSGSGVTVTVGAGAAADAQILLVGFDRERTTPVDRGENRGRTLTEANIVRAIRTIGDWHGSPVTLAESVPAGDDVAAILQAADGRILGASRL